MRKLLPYGLAIVLGLGSYLTSVPLRADDKPVDTTTSRSTVTEAEAFLEKLPTEIPDARDVKKYHVKGSKYCLVHIRQMHPRIDKSDTRKEMLEVDKVQRRVYGILDTLRNSGVRAVRLEGADIIEPGEDLSESIKKEYKEKKDATGLDFFPGGADRLVFEGKLTAKPGESVAYLLETARHLQRQGGFRDDAEEISLMYDGREDKALGMAEKDGEPVSVIVFGALHAWGGKESCGPDYRLKGRASRKDNIAIWNRDHPDGKFSLVEVTPKDMKEPPVSSEKD